MMSHWHDETGFCHDELISRCNLIAVDWTKRVRILCWSYVWHVAIFPSPRSATIFNVDTENTLNVWRSLMCSVRFGVTSNERNVYRWRPNEHLHFLTSTIKRRDAYTQYMFEQMTIFSVLLWFSSILSAHVFSRCFKANERSMRTKSKRMNCRK